MVRFVAAMRHVLFGNTRHHGLIAVALLYFVLLNVAFLYLNPLLYMLSTMLKSTADLLDPTVRWIPRTIDLHNLQLAWQGIRFPKSLLNSFTIGGLGAVFHVLSCSVIGYGFARFRFPGRNVLFALLIVCFLIPPATMTIPLYILYSKLGLLGSPLAIVGPALFGHGIRGALFVIIFRQFFMTMPREYDEAARIDGAGALRIFFKVMVPLAMPAILVVFLFSFIWHWNETYLTSLFLRGQYTPLSLSLNNLNRVLNELYGGGNGGFDPNESVKMAASFFIILPPLLLYAIAQKWFVRGVERTGIVE